MANSVGPLAAIYQIWQDSAVSSTATVDTWLLAVGGAAIVLGLACYGELSCGGECMGGSWTEKAEMRVSIRLGFPRECASWWIKGKLLVGVDNQLSHCAVEIVLSCVIPGGAGAL